MISRKEMFDRFHKYSDYIKLLMTEQDIPDKEIFNALCCPPYVRDEWTGFKITCGCGAYGIQEFTYKGFIFKITGVINEERFVCWLEQREDKSYLENVYLIPGAWIYGKSVDKEDVETIFLPAIDKYLQEVGVDIIE